MVDSLISIVCLSLLWDNVMDDLLGLMNPSYARLLLNGILTTWRVHYIRVGNLEIKLKIICNLHEQTILTAFLVLSEMSAYWNLLWFLSEIEIKNGKCYARLVLHKHQIKQHAGAGEAKNGAYWWELWTPRGNELETLKQAARMMAAAARRPSAKCLASVVGVSSLVSPATFRTRSIKLRSENIVPYF